MSTLRKTLKIVFIILGICLILLDIIGVVNLFSRGVIQTTLNPNVYGFAYLMGLLLPGIVGIVLLVVGFVIGKKR